MSLVSGPRGAQALESNGGSTPAGARPAVAERTAPPTIALVRSRGDEVIALRLVAELQALGFEVVEITGRDALRSLAQLAHSHEADALLRATPSRTGIELIVRVPPRGPSAGGSWAEFPLPDLVEDVVSVGRRRHDDLLALRAVEALRARLLEVGRIAPPEVFQAPEVQPLDLPAVEAELPPAPKEVPSLWLELGPALAVDVGTAWGARAQMGLRLEPAAGWSLSLLGNIPLEETTVTAAAGRARLNASWVGVAADARLVDSAVALDAGVGLALAWLEVEGEAEAPFAGRSTSIGTALPFLRVALQRELLPLLRLRLEALAGASAPRAVVGLGAEDVSWARPYAQVGLALAVAVPGLSHSVTKRSP